MKTAQYAELVSERKNCRRCASLANPSEIEGGRYDSEHIGPWSRWQGNLDASLLLVGQDWGDTGCLVRNKGVEPRYSATNENLMELLRSIGITIGPPQATAGQNVVFFTNAILCLKQGGLQGKVRSDWFQQCAPHLRRQIEIVQPKVVVALGAGAFWSVSCAFSLKRRMFRAAVEDSGGTMLPTGSRMFAVYHCSRRILNTHRQWPVQLSDWQRISRALQTSSPARRPP